MKKTAQRYPRIVLILIVLSFFISDTYAAQMMGTGRTRTVGPAMTKVSPERAKSAHTATPKSLLGVKKIYITPNRPRLGDKVAIHALVANNGSKAVRRVKVDLYLGKKIVAWQIYDIPAKGCREYTGYFTKIQAPRPGPYTVRALIDPNHALERSFYKCNTASLKITILPPIVHSTVTTAVKGRKPVLGTRSRHVSIRPGQTAGRVPPVNSVEMKPSMHPPTDRRHTPVTPGKISHVTARTQSHYISDRARSRWPSPFSLDIHWNRTGVLSNRVDIFLRPYRNAGKGVCLKHNIANNGHATLPVPGNIRTGQHYTVRVQTRDGKVYGDSRPFSSPLHMSRKANKPSKAAPFLTPPAPLLKVVSPKQGDTWTINKAHTIKWLLLGPKTTIREISLWNVSRPEKFVLSIYPAHSGQPISRIANSFPWTVPATLTGGEYYILLKAGTLTAKSAPFQIVLPSHMTMQQSPGGSKPRPDHMEPLNPNRPRITYFFAPANIYEKNTVAGRLFYIPYPRMPLSIYWQDPDGDLGRGRYRFTYSYSCDSYPGEKRDLGWKSFNATDDYCGKKGMGVFSFELLQSCSPHTFSYSFTLMDKAGHKSNTVRGTVHWVHQDDEVTTDKDHVTDPPPSSTPEKQSGLTLFAPDEWVTGLPVYIGGTMPAGSLKKNNRYEITLWNVSGKGCGKNLKETITVNYTSSTAFHLTWSVDPVLRPGPYCLQALVNKTFSTTKIITVTKAGLALEPVQGPFNVGESLQVRWKTTVPGSGKYRYNLYWHSYSNGTDYPVGNGKIGTRSFTWKVGTCLATNASTALGRLPPSALGKGFLHFKSRLYGCSARTNDFKILERPLDYKNLNIRIIDPDRNTQWGGQTYQVRWKYTKKTPFCQIEVSVINAISGQTVSGPWTAYSLDGKIRVHIPEYDSSHNILAIPARIKIKPQGTISEEYTVYSDPFEIL